MTGPTCRYPRESAGVAQSRIAWAGIRWRIALAKPLVIRHYPAIRGLVRMAVVLVATALLAMGVAACGDDEVQSSVDGGQALGRCHFGGPPVIGNVVIWFLGDVQQGRDPLIEGGVDDPWGCAYRTLCSEQREAVSEESFEESQGEAVSALLTADTHAGPSVYVDRGLREEYPKEDPPAEVTEAWMEVEATWYEHIDDRTIVSDSGRSEVWRRGSRPARATGLAGVSLHARPLGKPSRSEVLRSGRGAVAMLEQPDRPERSVLRRRRRTQLDRRAVRLAVRQRGPR